MTKNSPKMMNKLTKLVGKVNISLLVIVSVVMFVFIVDGNDSQLIINVRNQGGDIVQETILSNVTDDTITLEFQRSDGTLVTQLIDFRNEVQVLKSLILGEEERGQSQYQVMCFVFHFPKDSFISSDAMAKLRQKNPSAVRLPEEDLGRKNHSMDYSVVLRHSGVISPHVADLCAEAALSTYTWHGDVVEWARAQGIPISSYQPALRSLPTAENRCSATKTGWQHCECRLEMCVGWYPCKLKFCKGRNRSSYRCGIRTCRVCRVFEYFVEKKELCLWDEGTL